MCRSMFKKKKKCNIYRKIYNLILYFMKIQIENLFYRNIFEFLIYFLIRVKNLK